MYYFVTLLFILLSDKATFMDDMNICWFLVSAIFLFIALGKNKLTYGDTRFFGMFLLIYAAFCAVRSFFFNQLPLSFLLDDLVFPFKYLLPSFLFCVILRERAIEYLTKVIFHLALLSLPLYCLQLISGNTVYAIGKFLNLPYAHFDGYVNMIFFTYVKVHAIRNSGFSWEPGAFGFFLIMGLLFNFFSNNFKFDRKAIVMTIALVTTISTTSYLAFMVVILLFFRARGVKFGKLLFFIVPILLVFAVSLPFLFDKIGVVYRRDMGDLKNLQTLNQTYIRMGVVMPLNRFASMLFLWNHEGVRLLWGVSNSYRDTIPILKNISLSNGIFILLTQFGAIGMLYLLYRSYLLFKKINGRAEIAAYCVAILLILGFSEVVFVTSLVLSFLFMYRYALPATQEDLVDEDEEAKSVVLKFNPVLPLRTE